VDCGLIHSITDERIDLSFDFCAVGMGWDNGRNRHTFLALFGEEPGIPNVFIRNFHVNLHEGRVMVYTSSDGENYRYVITPMTFIDGKRRHVDIVKVGSLAIIYIDGENVKSGSVYPICSSLAAIPISIGALQHLPVRNFLNGSIHNISLSLNSVLVGYWRGGAQDTDWLDLSGNGHHGTIQGNTERCLMTRKGGYLVRTDGQGDRYLEQYV